MIKRIPYWYILLAPFVIFALGYMMNATVVAANQGMMPVLYSVCPANIGDTVHTCFSPKTRLSFLADWLFTVTPTGISMYSPGDYLIILSRSIQNICLVSWAVLMIKKVQDARRNLSSRFI